MGLAAAHWGHGLGRHAHGVSAGVVDASCGLRQDCCSRGVCARLIGRGKERMAVRGYLRNRHRYLLRATGLGQDEAIPKMKRDSASQIWQREGALTVTAVGGADQLKEGFIFRDGKQLSFAKHPAGGREVPREDSYFTDVRLSHRSLLRSAMGRFPAGRCRKSAPGMVACSDGPGCRRRLKWIGD